MLDQDAVLICGSPAFVQDLATRLSAYALTTRTSPAPLSEMSRLKSGASPAALLINPLGQDQATLNKSAVLANALAKKTQAELLYIPGEERDLWQNELNKAAMYSALPAPVQDSADGILSRLLKDDQKNLCVVCPREDSRFLTQFLVYLSGTERLIHQNLYTTDKTYQAVSPLSPSGALPLFALLFAAADLIREGLRLEREADCLSTVVANVLTSGWRTPEFMETGENVITPQEVMNLIAQQVQLAGELYERMG